MATRVYCDNCGNTIKTPNVLSYGSLHDAINEHYQVMAGHQGVGGLSLGQLHAKQNAQQTKPKIPVISVDLCDTCVPIWMSRVANLTKASEPD